MDIQGGGRLFGVEIVGVGWGLFGCGEDCLEGVEFVEVGWGLLE